MLTPISVANIVNPKKHNNSRKMSFGLRNFPVNYAKTLGRNLLHRTVETVAVCTHRSPDEDTLNLAKVCIRWLGVHGKRGILYTEVNRIQGLNINPGNYEMPNANSRLVPQRILFVDFNSRERLPRGTGIKDILRRIAPARVVGIDHHPIKKPGKLVSANMYTDHTSHSCCGVGWNFFRALGEERLLSLRDIRNLYCGMLSDYLQAGLVRFDERNSGLIKTPYFFAPGNAGERRVLEELESKLSRREQQKVHGHLNIIENLTPQEASFKQRVFSQVKVTEDGKLAYVIIPPEDAEWKQLGEYNPRNSTILKDVRKSLLGKVQENDAFTDEQKVRFKGVQAAIVFYKDGDDYQMGIYSRGGYAGRLIDGANQLFTDSDLEEAGGRPNRAGGRVHSLKPEDVRKFIQKFFIANDCISGIRM